MKIVFVLVRVFVKTEDIFFTNTHTSTEHAELRR